MIQFKTIDGLLLRDMVMAGTANLEKNREAVDALNARLGGGFFLLSRPRTRTPEGRWQGWERKRGALLALARLLCGEENELRVDGDADALAGFHLEAEPVEDV